MIYLYFEVVTKTVQLFHASITSPISPYQSGGKVRTSSSFDFSIVSTVVHVSRAL